MADSPDELDPTQATEAKLCAYLEGALSAGDRVEIEKYLTQSPTHRKLLRDLAATREWVSNLPKEWAPPEIAELFEQHAERTMLLDDSASAVSVSVNRGPQVMLAAAIGLLAVGLGAIIFIVLNERGPTAQNYASSMKASNSSPPATSPAPIPGTVARSISIPPVRESSPAASVVPASPVATATSPALPLTDGASAFVPTTMPAMSMSTTRTYAAQQQQQQQNMKAQPSTERSTAELNNNGGRPPNAAAGTVAATIAPTTQPMTVAVGDRLLVDIPQLVGPGVEKTTTVRVELDGKITLPMLDAMPAAGKSTIDLQKLIADRYRQENLIANPIVAVTRLAPPPTSMPTTRPSTAPTTRPAR